MKTRQTLTDDTSGYVKKLSPTLHFLAMPGFLLLREDFGYLFFRPKRYLIPIAAIALGVPLYILCNAPNPWPLVRHNFFEFWFFVGSGVNYFDGLIRSIWGQFRGKGPDDRYSGTSGWFPKKWRTPGRDAAVKILGDPLIIFLVGSLMTYIQHTAFGFLLHVVAVAMLVSETMNWWVTLRVAKKGADMRGEAELAGQNAISPFEPAVLLESSRQPGKQRPRIFQEPVPEEVKIVQLSFDDASEREHAATLEMFPPYSLEQAEEQFRILYLDASPLPPNQNLVRVERLFAAREYFRHKNQKDAA